MEEKVAVQPHTPKPYNSGLSGDVIYCYSVIKMYFYKTREQKSGSVRIKTDKTMQQTLRTRPHEEMLIIPVMLFSKA